MPLEDSEEAHVWAHDAPFWEIVRAVADDVELYVSVSISPLQKPIHAVPHLFRRPEERQPGPGVYHWG